MLNFVFVCSILIKKKNLHFNKSGVFLLQCAGKNDSESQCKLETILFNWAHKHDSQIDFAGLKG